MAFEWRPQPRQELFMRNMAYEALFGGAKGPGKTDALLAESIRQSSNPDYRAIIFRRTTPRLSEIIDRSKRWFVGWGKFNQQNLTWTFPHPTIRGRNGWKLKFAHCQNEDDKFNYHGHEYHYMGFDQVEEFTETQYLFLVAQNRTARKDIRCYIRATANPGNIGHAWVKKRFIDKCDGNGAISWFKQVIDKDGMAEEVECSPTDPRAMSRAFVFSTVYDNKMLLESSPQYIQVLEMLPDKERAMMLRGDWDQFAGMYFHEWDKLKHISKEQLSPELSYFLSLDYGYSKPSSVGFWCVFPDGRLHRFKEIYIEKHNYEQLGRLIYSAMDSKIHYDYLVADPAIWGDKSHHKGSLSGESGAETLQNILPCVVVKGDNSRVVGWGRLRIFLQNGLISCSPSCRDSIRTIPQLIHDERNVEDLNTDGEDHAADDWRYAVMSRPMPKMSLVKMDDFDIKVGQDVKIVRKSSSERASERLRKEIDRIQNKRDGHTSSTINPYMGNQW